MGSKLGFVGLGNMGMPMALRLLDAGHEVVGCDVREGVRGSFEVRGGLTRLQ